MLRCMRWPAASTLPLPLPHLLVPFAPALLTAAPPASTAGLRCLPCWLSASSTWPGTPLASCCADERAGAAMREAAADRASRRVRRWCMSRCGE